MKNFLKMSGVITIAVIMCASFASCVEEVDEISYTITFDPMADDVDTPESQSAINGEVTNPWATYATRPNRADFVFDGWYTEKEFTTKWNFNTDRADEDMTLYARWLPAVTVNFVVDNNESLLFPLIIIPDSDKIATGTKTTEPTLFNASLFLNYAFEGWYKEQAFTNRWNFDDPVTESMTLYGNFLPCFTVTFNSNGGSVVANQPGFEGKKINKPADPTKAGNDFAGWYSDLTLTTAWNFDSGTVSQDITLYAKWTVTITFNSNGGSNVSEQVITSGTKANSVNNPTKIGFTFGGWYKDTGLTQAWNSGTDTFNVHSTLYAKWTLALDPGWYQITGSGTSFTATKGSSTIGTTGTISSVIDAIKSDASNAACTIFFGDGDNWLDIGEEYVQFNDGWGAITLNGKITSAKAYTITDAYVYGTVTIGNHTMENSTSSISSVTSYADIRNTSGPRVYAVLCRLSAANSTMTINGGTISVASNSSTAIALQLYTGSYVINNATITATAGYAIYSDSSSTSTLTIGGSSKVTSQSGIAVFSSYGSLNVNDNATVSSGTASAINIDSGTVTINGGTVTSAAPATYTPTGGSLQNYGAIRLSATGSINPSNLIINGGTVSNTHSTNGYAISVRYTNNSVYSNITLKGGIITAPVTAINHLGAPSSMITFAGGLSSTLVINGVVIPSVNTDGDGNVKVDGTFSIAGKIKLNFVSPVAGKIAVINGLDSSSDFELTNPGFTLGAKYLSEDLFIDAE